MDALLVSTSEINGAIKEFKIITSKIKPKIKLKHNNDIIVKFWKETESQGNLQITIVDNNEITFELKITGTGNNKLLATHVSCYEPCY